MSTRLRRPWLWLATWGCVFLSAAILGTGVILLLTAPSQISDQHPWNALKDIGPAIAGSWVAELARLGVRLNICPTSNLKLGRVASLQAHPIRRLYDAGVRMTVNTDDLLIFGCSLSGEFLALFEAGLFSATELDGIRLAAFD